MFDSEIPDQEYLQPITFTRYATVTSGFLFKLGKRAFDLTVSAFVLLPLTLLVGAMLLLLNPFWNKGSLLFTQERMGRNCKAFTAYKFRTMRAVDRIERSADCPLETDRITPLGHFMRRSRIDELPQIINIFKGEMSLIGPRPDYFEHALEYLSHVPGYQMRHHVRPGISGLAQVELGYVQGTEATRQKVQADIHYITNTGLVMEARIVWRTLAVMVQRDGA